MERKGLVEMLIGKKLNRSLKELKIAVRIAQKSNPATQKDYAAIFVRAPVPRPGMKTQYVLRKTKLHLLVLIWERRSLQMLSQIVFSIKFSVI